ncbi:MAG TPA: hypothetical protein VN429_07970 [Methanospirillum sp.]|uniref:hypothetical protein n=1 Tax=Methanospirillum sp. TaxID=45200 RepID=UPI002D082E25|nr:hypothetical protein [Methanospirillum sp.]HWQ64340.1 hypothetical protein [Methanospirillum sp.]
MPPVIHPAISGSSGSFSVIAAPVGILLEALSTLLRSNQNQTLYLCGNYPQILTKLFVNHDHVKIRRALTAYQILTILEDADEPLILFEHDRSWYQDTPELIPIIGEICRRKSANLQMVLLFSDRVDRWFSEIDPYANRVVYYLDTLAKPRKNHSTPVNIQNTLEGLW